MGKHMEELREMLCDELDKIGGKGELTAGSLDTIDKLSHSIKSIDTIMAMEEAGYSQEGYDTYDNSYRGNSYARQRMRRNSRGRNSYRGYSRDDSKEDMIEQLEDMMEDAKDSKVKEAIKKAIRQIEE